MPKLQIQTFKTPDLEFGYLGARLLKTLIWTLGIQEPPKLRNQVSDRANLLRLWEVENLFRLARDIIIDFKLDTLVNDFFKRFQSLSPKFTSLSSSKVSSSWSPLLAIGRIIIKKDNNRCKHGKSLCEKSVSTQSWRLKRFILMTWIYML